MKKAHQIVYLICLTSFIAITWGFTKYIFNVITPQIVETLGLDYEFIGIINVCYMITMNIFSLIGGFLSARLGAKNIVTYSVLLCSIAIMSLYFIIDKWFLLIIVSVFGILASTSWIPIVEMVSRTIAKENRGKSLGIISCGTSWSMLLNGMLIPIILLNFSWQTVWLIFGIISLFIGSISVYIVNRTKNREDVDDLAEASTDKSLLNGSPNGQNPSYLQYFLMIIMLLLTGLGLIPFMSYLSALLQDDFGMSQAVIGLCWSMIGLLGIGSGFLSGILADKYSAKLSMIILNSIAVIAMAGVLVLNGPVLGVVCCSLYGLAYYGLFGLHATYAANIMPPEKSAKLFGVFNVAVSVGGAIGNYYSAYLKDVLGSFIMPYTIMAIMATGSLAICFIIRDDKRPPAAGLARAQTDALSSMEM